MDNGAARGGHLPSELPGDLPDGLFVGIDHVGVAVADLDAAISFHTDVLGWRVLHRECNEDQGVAEAMLGTGRVGADSVLLQLLAPLRPDSPIGKFLDRNGPGLQQLAYRVTDIDAVSAVLRERGVRLLYDEPRRGTAGSRINFVHPKDAGGVLLELVQPADEDTAASK
jgi:methylmalonyl-CoA/ethylmalonyl-CoA epimerase